MKIKKNTLVISTFFIVFFALLSCEKILPPAPDPASVLDSPIEGLTDAQKRLFLEGDEEFDEVYTEETGLGPIYVASSCTSCHSGDNRGHPFTALTRFGQSDTIGNQFLSQGGPQLQHNFIAGHLGEQLPMGATSSKFIAPIVAGVGFIEYVSELDILAMADPNDMDGDGISGRVNWNTIPNWVIPRPNALSRYGKYICRFGRKAGTYNLHQQAVQAFNQDMGITTSFMPQNPINYLSGTNPVTSSDLDISDHSVNATVFYIQTLQAPIQRNKTDENVQQGAIIFNQIKCNSCHKEKLMTGYSPITALNNKEFYPYTDLLLHDMGNELDDHYTEGTAFTNEWRTTPLWGLGLAILSQGGNYFLMHDGRATSIEQAIEMHGGEALQSRTNYMQLNTSEQAALIDFLKSL